MGKSSDLPSNNEAVIPTIIAKQSSKHPVNISEDPVDGNGSTISPNFANVDGPCRSGPVIVFPGRPPRAYRLNLTASSSSRDPYGHRRTFSPRIPASVIRKSLQDSDNIEIETTPDAGVEGDGGAAVLTTADRTGIPRGIETDDDADEVCEADDEEEESSRKNRSGRPHLKGTYGTADKITVPETILKANNAKTSTIRQHYYPEGGWGWVICVCAFFVQLLTTGLQLSYGVLYVHVLKQFGQDKGMHAVWLGSLSYSLGFFISPLVVAFCRRKSVRLTAIFGGLIAALGCLFSSFASQFHQVMLSYGVFLAVGVGMTRETANLLIGQYFKRKRDKVEIIVQMGSGAGIAVMSVVIRESIRSLKWRLGLQSVTLVVFTTFVIGIFYRPASLYHPQRRAIVHLKNQRRKIRDKSLVLAERTPFLEFSLLGTRTLQIIMLSTAICSFGCATPLFHMVYLVEQESKLDNTSVLLLQVYLGLAFMLGCGVFGFLVIKRNAQCTISKQNLCQAAMFGLGIAILSFGAVDGYRGYVLFVWFYGIFNGGLHYILKVYVFERIRTKHFSKAWAYVQWAKSIPVLLGIPAAGYINQNHGSKAGFYYGCVCAILGSVTLSLMTSSCRKRSHGIRSTTVEPCAFHHCDLLNYPDYGSADQFCPTCHSSVETPVRSKKTGGAAAPSAPKRQTAHRIDQYQKMISFNTSVDVIDDDAAARRPEVLKCISEEGLLDLIHDEWCVGDCVAATNDDRDSNLRTGCQFEHDLVFQNAAVQNSVVDNWTKIIPPSQEMCKTNNEQFIQIDNALRHYMAEATDCSQCNPNASTSPFCAQQQPVRRSMTVIEEMTTSTV